MQRCSMPSGPAGRLRPIAKLIEVDAHINDPAFAEAAVQAFRDIF